MRAAEWTQEWFRQPEPCTLQGLSRCAAERQPSMCSFWETWATCSEHLICSLDGLHQSELQRLGLTSLGRQGDLLQRMHYR